MTFPIGSNDPARSANAARSPLDAGSGCQNGRCGGQQPLNLFEGDQLGKAGGSGLFPKGAGGAGGIEELLATMNKGKKEQFDTGNVSNGLFSGGKDMGSKGEDGGGAGKSGGGGGLQQVLGQIMGIVQKILPMLGGMLGGL